MALNEPRDLTRHQPEFWLLKWSHGAFLRDLKARGVPELGESLNLVDEHYDVVLVDFSEWEYCCDTSPSVFAESVYATTAINTECEDEELREELYTWFEAGGVCDPFYIYLRDAEGLKARGVHIETSPTEIAEALEDSDGDHEAAYEALRDRILEYYRCNQPL